MSRKPAAVVATALAAILIVGLSVVVVVGRSQRPTPTASSHPTPTAMPSTTPVSTPSTPAKHNSGSPIPDPTAAAAAGNAKVIFFSFDDGPDPIFTPKVLQVLRKHGAHATFFQLGSMVGAHPGLRDQILAEGNTIGNHSISHRQLTAVNPGRRHQEIFGGPKSKCFRPPYGATNPKVRADIKAAGMAQVLWDVDPRDWKQPGVTAIANNILRNAHRGSIVLMHDGGGDRSQTVAALDRVLPILKARGYTFPAMAC